MKVESQQIKEMNYDPKGRILSVTFHYKDRTHVYANVPEQTWKEFQGAISKGRFFHQFIRPHFHQLRVH